MYCIVYLLDDVIVLAIVVRLVSFVSTRTCVDSVIHEPFRHGRGAERGGVIYLL